MAEFVKADVTWFNLDVVGSVWAASDGSSWAVKIYYPASNRDVTAKSGYASQADAEAAALVLIAGRDI
jgi:hypothetical protein